MKTTLTNTLAWIKKNKTLTFYFLLTLLLPFFQFNKSHFYNYNIFTYSAEHLLNLADLYAKYDFPKFDYFKYSPSFALIMVPFYWMPTLLGLVLFTIMQTSVFLFTIKKLELTVNQRNAILLICLPEFIGATQVFQTNIIVASLFILSFVYLKKEQISKAALFLALGFHVKLFTLVGLLFGMLFKGGIRFGCYFVLWTVGIALIPVLVTSFDFIGSQYMSWLNLLRWDSGASVGYSLMGIVYGFTEYRMNNLATQLFFGIMLLLPLLTRRSLISHPIFQLNFLASVLLWVIAFNHKSESPTFIIAMTGIAIWWVYTDIKYKKIALFACLFFTSLLYSDLVSRSIRETYVSPYALKALPVVALWFYIQYKLLIGAFPKLKDE